MKKLLIATKNQAKLREISNFLAGLPLEIISLKDVGIDEEVEEDGDTYKENAEKKAKRYAELSGLPSLADDTGIEIDALNGEPGRYTRRWLGFHMTDDEIINHLKKISQELPEDNRKATFKCTTCLALPSGNIFFETGEVEGIIARDYVNKRVEGFPFRGFFFLPEINKFFFEDELTEDEQKLYNHRYKAVDKMRKIITQELL